MTDHQKKINKIIEAQNKIIEYIKEEQSMISSHIDSMNRLQKEYQALQMRLSSIMQEDERSVVL